MPSYSYKCSDCESYQEVWHLMSEEPPVKCVNCLGKCYKVITQPPQTVVPPQFSPTMSKEKYYAIDFITGRGITEHTDVSEPPGIRVKSHQK